MILSLNDLNFEIFGFNITQTPENFSMFEFETETNIKSELKNLVNEKIKISLNNKILLKSVYLLRFWTDDNKYILSLKKEED